MAEYEISAGSDTDLSSGWGIRFHANAKLIQIKCASPRVRVARIIRDGQGNEIDESEVAWQRNADDPEWISLSPLEADIA